MKTGARQMVNWRILNSHAVQNRPGRTALFQEFGRVEKVQMAPGQFFYLAFGNGYIRVYNAAGTRVYSNTVFGGGIRPISWTTATLGGITYAISGLFIYIFYPDGAPNNVPQILSWDGVSQTSTWLLSPYAEAIAAGGQKRTYFYRISPPNITLQPSATKGAINISFSTAVLVAGHVGTRMRYCGRQILITQVNSGTLGTAIVIEPLPPGQVLTLSSTIGIFNIGDTIRGGTSGALGIVTTSPSAQVIAFTAGAGALAVGASVTGGTSAATGVVTAIDYGVVGGGGGFGGSPSPLTMTVSLSTSTLFQAAEVISSGGNNVTSTTVTGASLTVQLLQSGSATAVNAFTAETVAGPSGSAAVSGVATTVPQAVSVWDDEVMNVFRGYPSSVFFDQSRLGMCNFPSVPSAIGWSAIGLPTDLYVGALPQNSIFNLVPGNPQVLYVVAGLESSEFVFCDNSILYIPITTANPLVPGNVQFNALAAHGCMPKVQPRRADQTVVYMKAGGGAVGAIQAPGAYFRPYIVEAMSDLHSHLFTASPAVSIAIPSAATQFEELYIYVALANGSIVTGRYSMKQGLIEPGADGKPKIGWSPWNGGGTVTWIAALQDAVIFSSQYILPGIAATGIPSVGIIEQLDNTQYLDAAIAVNSVPAPFAGERPSHPDRPGHPLHGHLQHRRNRLPRSAEPRR